jgi:hypothetical protein
MPAIWHSIADEINGLERAHAKEVSWSGASSSVQNISTLAELINICPGDMSSDDLQTAFARSTKVVHYGFEELHALVFFDRAGCSWKVIKW